MPRLGVNIDHIATVRQARKGDFPDPLQAAGTVKKAGADGITVHLREDRRHIQEKDVRAIRRKVRLPLNLEMAATSAMVAFARKVRPQEACLVPERREELTTEGGLDAASRVPDLKKKILALKKAEILVSIFVDPSIRQVRAAALAGADCVELHTGRYADSKGKAAQRREFAKLAAAGKEARRLGLILNAGHGLGYGNVRRVARIPGMNGLNIGFSIVSRALFTGLERAVRDMKALVKI
ncbi:MAG: pyridoxine 5'-phosphate synthase [Elusimicrobia bacterium RIFCSPLOWO2_01_FULL_60_11]|nr:MAG: pyridoxine 5'-phosphate synthase [Elusimicrobia bacterium RIFCSPLOWO2_01_FULL_60_11]